MKQYRPTYYKDFRCIASACKDNCCIGWEIDIDDNTAAFYRGIGGDFGCRLKQNILRDETGSQFILKEDERCPFLNENNLCEIYIHLGESALCEICTQHPRYHEWFGNRKESGVGLCCEAAGRLIFSQDKTSFETVEINEEAADPVDEEAFSALQSAREAAISLMQERSLPFGKRLLLLLSMGEELQQALDFEDFEEIRAIAVDYSDIAFLMEQSFPALTDGEAATEQLLSYLSTLEPIDPQWPSRLHSIRSQLRSLLNSHQPLLNENYFKDMEQLAIYLLFRYFCKALFDGDLRSKTMLCAVGCCLVALLDAHTWQNSAHFSLEERVQNAKAFSKEIEYCTENLEALCDGFWSGESLSHTQICSLTALLFPYL